MFSDHQVVSTSNGSPESVWYVSSSGTNGVSSVTSGTEGPPEQVDGVAPSLGPGQLVHAEELRPGVCGDHRLDGERVTLRLGTGEDAVLLAVAQCFDERCSVLRHAGHVDLLVPLRHG